MRSSPGYAAKPSCGSSGASVTSPLENLSGLGQPLRKEPPDPREFANLKQSGLKRLADAENNSNALESRFDLAYNGAHALCIAPQIAMSCFRPFRIRWGWGRMYGGFWPRLMTFAIA